jgi:hypothetical protein
MRSRFGRNQDEAIVAELWPPHIEVSKLALIAPIQHNLEAELHHKNTVIQTSRHGAFPGLGSSMEGRVKSTTVRSEGMRPRSKRARHLVPNANCFAFGERSVLDAVVLYEFARISVFHIQQQIRRDRTACVVGFQRK